MENLELLKAEHRLCDSVRETEPIRSPELVGLCGERPGRKKSAAYTAPEKIMPAEAPAKSRYAGHRARQARTGAKMRKRGLAAKGFRRFSPGLSCNLSARQASNRKRGCRDSADN